MSDHVIAASRRTSAMERYLEAETRLWQHYGSAPRNRFVDIPRPRARLRILEAGSGPPVLFIHGTVGPGSWASLVAGLPGFRCLVLDRPGWGLSTPVEYPSGGYRAYVADLMAGLLDALDIDRIDLVGGSIGYVWALSLAEHHPDRVNRIVMLGDAPLVVELQPPPFIRLLRTPVGALIVRLPMSANRLRAILRQNGHGPSLDDGRIPAEFIDWRRSLANDTGSMRHERDMVRAVLDRNGWKPDFSFDDRSFQRIDHPNLLVHGTADPTGSAGLWRRVAGTLGNGRLELIDGAGHQPWFDDPRRVTGLVEQFLSEPA